MRVTIYDVAKRAGVSTATVSKVLSRTPYVSEETRAKVLAAVEELDYVPSLAARGLTKARTFIIGLAFPYPRDYLFTDPHLLTFIRGVEQVAADRDYNILLAPARQEGDAASSLRRLLHTQYVDGAIVAGMQSMAAGASELRRWRYPTVALGYHSPTGSSNTVHADDRNGAAAATQHLLRLGHRRIGVITAASSITAVSERLEGHLSALQEAGLSFEPELIVTGDFSTQSGYLAASDLLGLRPPPTAIFAFNDRMAMGAIQRLREAGLAVPRDVAVVGFDDIPEAAVFDPPLTTVRQPALEMGITAACMLFDLIDGKASGFSERVLPAELVVRKSCGACRENMGDPTS